MATTPVPVVVPELHSSKTDDCLELEMREKFEKVGYLYLMHVRIRHIRVLTFFGCFGLVALLFFAACIEVEKQQKLPQKKIYNSSFLWDSTRQILIKTDIRLLMEEYLEEAKANYFDDTTDLNAAIWYGRRLAYLHHFSTAVSVFTNSLKMHPASPELYRHRGHRWITLRQFHKAVSDLKKAEQLALEKSMEVEPDGIPNKLNIPLSNLHFNIYYHLGLAYYLMADYSAALTAWSMCWTYCDNDDLLVAVTYWSVLGNMKTNRVSQVDSLLLLIHPDMEIIENVDYHHQLLEFKEEFDSEGSYNTVDADSINSTALYGQSVWKEFTGDSSASAKLRKQILSTNNWAYFGYIAAEADSLIILNKG